MLPRIHIALVVRDLDASIAFYSKLLQVEPTKVREGYAKLEGREPSVNLTLNQSTTAAVHHTTEHFGIEVDSTEHVVAAHGRMKAAGFATLSEEGVTCCFAVQDKVWIVDPDGYRWEVYVKHADAEVHSIPQGAVSDDECCADQPACC